MQLGAKLEARRSLIFISLPSSLRQRLHKTVCNRASRVNVRCERQSALDASGALKTHAVSWPRHGEWRRPVRRQGRPAGGGR